MSEFVFLDELLSCFWYHWTLLLRPCEPAVTVAATPTAPTSLLPLTACGSKGSDHLTLACIARDFSPAGSVTFQWKNTCGMAVTEFTQYPPVEINGFYTSISHVNVKAAERESYSCSVNHSLLSEKMEVSFQKPADQPSETPCLEVTLNPPKMSELFVNNRAVLDCVITGGERAAVEGASVTWTPSGSTSSEITQHGHLFRKTSTLTLGREHWFPNQKVECSVQQISNKPTIKKSFSRNTSVSDGPEVVLITPIKEKGLSSEFVCVVTGFSPWDVFVMWRVDNGPSFEDGITSEPVKRYDGTYSVTSFFKVPTAKWKSNVTCNVQHISMSKDAAPIIGLVSKVPGNPECD